MSKNMMQIELVPVGEGVEDWYMEVNGLNAGYLYESTKGWAVGVASKLGSNAIGPYRIAASKDAALAFAHENLPK